jgi:hypothetical protein
VRVFVLMLSAILAYLSRGLKKEQNYSRETAFGMLCERFCSSIVHFRENLSICSLISSYFAIAD